MAKANDLTGSRERTAETIRRDIAAKRESISETVDRLGTRIQEKVDWRQWVSQYPYVAIGTAAGLGALLSAISKARRSPTQRIGDALGDIVKNTLEDIKQRVGDVAFQTMQPVIVKSSLGVAVGRTVIEFIKRANENRVCRMAEDDTHGSPTGHVQMRRL
jgi:ElaB/YqjD/DUF883 family membrane-anchored ribosome-binding protein